MNTITEQLNAIQSRLDALEQEKTDLLRQKANLLATSPAEPVRTLSSAKLTSQQKVALFGRLFRGREDIYAQRWENQQGRSGYSVACAHEWQPGLCEKPRIKCGECPHRAFLPLTDHTLHAHLTGKSSLGLYPLLPDNHCWFLAVDFDKQDWQNAISAFHQACLAWEIPCAVERSRSGQGGHAWLFFAEPIEAKEARRLGFALLDNAMEQHAELSFDSYDRLFPNQDYLPAGGFGNLIALPLQYRPRQAGNSAFIDADFQPYADQWHYLMSLIPIKRQQVATCLERLQEDPEKSLGELKPWERSLPVATTTLPGCPSTIRLTLANRLYLPCDELPQPLVARLKRLASFSNPAFFRAQNLRLSTQGLPRYICLAHIDQGYLSLPRGCLDGALALLAEQSITVEQEDLRKRGKPLTGLTFKGQLRKDQTKAVKALAKHDIGILHAPTAFGKTVTAIGLIHKRKVNTLILVHSRQLLDQWRERLALFLEGTTIGVMGGGKQKLSGEIDAATYQSMIKRSDNSVSEHLYQYGQVIIDECHHISASKYDTLLSEVHARYVLGVTATPQRQDGHQPIIFMQAGPIRHSVSSEHHNTFEQRVIVQQLNTTLPSEWNISESRPHIAEIYRWLMLDETRNQRLIDDVLAEVKQKRHPLVLTERREHALTLAARLADQSISCQVLRGAMKAKERTAAIEALDKTQVLVATGKYIGEGFDLPRLDTLFLALPISWKGSLAQYAGRIHRQVDGKERVTIYDYVDTTLPTLRRMYQRRVKGYNAMGYTIAETPEQALVQVNMVLADKP